MPLTEANVEQITARVVALDNRFLEIRETSNLLRQNTLWRSQDGSLTAGTISQADKKRITAYLNTLLNEAEAIIATVRGMLATE